nr:E261 [uncultured bacterium]
MDGMAHVFELHCELTVCTVEFAGLDFEFLLPLFLVHQSFPAT